jgi:phytoene dehydrogenase-like protein
MKNIAIVGAGIGGLVAGNLLARQGHKVTIFEAHVTPGGYTAGFWRKGFYFESGTLSFESSNEVFKALKDIGVYDKLAFERLSYRFLSKDLDGSPASYEEMKKLYLAAYPAQKQSLERYFKELDRLYAPFVALMWPAPLWKKVVATPALGMLYLKYRNVTIPEFVRRYFPEDSVLYRQFSSIGYPDMPALAIGAAYHTVFNDLWKVKDGFQALADVLSENFRKLGGDLRLGTRVEKILTHGGAAVGVRCEGKDIPADAVISASDYKKTFLKLLSPEDVPAPLRERIEKTPVSEGFTAAYLGLAMPNDELRKIMHRSHVICDEIAPGADVRNSGDPGYFERARFSVFSLSLDNPRLAPEGKSSIMAEVTTPFRWMDNWGGGDRQKYLQLKSRVLETLIDRVEAALPGIRNAVELKDLATPLTFERYTANTDGASSAWSWNPKKKFYRNPLRIYVDTPVRNLYVGSCWASQMGGVPGAIAAAYACAKKTGA